MKKVFTILIVCLFLAFGISLLVPVEDTQETNYNDSEEMPYHDSPLFSIVPARKVGVKGEVARHSPHYQVSAPSQFAVALQKIDTHRTRCARLSSELCILLC